MRIALVVMPWIDPSICPLGPAALKAYLQIHGVETDVHYLHLRMADRIGLRLYTALARSSRLWPEWLFAHHLFGPGGTGELKERLEDVERLPSFREFLEEAEIPAGRFRALLQDDVPAFLEESLAQVPWSDYGLVGFSSTMYSHAACLALAKRLKERARVPVAVGGPNVEGAMGQATLAGCDWIDFAVDGEGEEALLALARGLRAGQPFEPPARVTMRSGGRLLRGPAGDLLDMATLPPADHDDFFRWLDRCPRLAGMDATLTFETSRGCWWGQKQHCTFCGIPDAALVFRAKPARAAAEQIWEMHRRYGVSRLYATDLIMGLDHQRELLPELARLRRENDSDLRLFYESKANLTRAQLQSLADAGVCELLAGIESLSTAALQRMRKGARAIQNVQTLKWGQASGIKVVWNYLYGLPGEDLEEHVRAADAMLSLTHLEPPAACGPVRPDRSSPLHDRCEEFGLNSVRPDPIYRYLYPEGRFALADIAYSFEFEEGAVTASSDPRLDLLRRTIAFWAKSWPRNFFASRRGAASVELFDARPSRLGASSELRQDRLIGLEAFVFRRCETIQTVGQVAEACRREDASWTPARVEETLESMTRRRWLWREDGFYLGLAVPVDRLPAAQRFWFDALQAAARRLPASIARLPLS